MNSPHSTNGSAAVVEPVSVAAGDLVAEIVGGSLLTVTSLRHRGEELLVSPAELPPGYRVHDARAGITLLHPWANRLGSDTYTFSGVTGRLDSPGRADGTRLTRDAHGLAIHGLMGDHPWRLTADGPSTCHASLTWLDTPAFPFAHQILVRFEAVAERREPPERREPGVALRISATVAALNAVPVPVAFGWHPYFRCDRSAGAELELPRLAVLEADERGLPTGRCTPRDPARISLVDQSLDHGALLMGSEMRFHQSAPGRSARSIAVACDRGYAYGQVFAPADAPVVSLEPMTAPTDALRRGTGLPMAAADRPYTTQFTVRVR